MIVWIGMGRCCATVIKIMNKICAYYTQKKQLMYLDLRFFTSNMTLKLAVLSHPTDEVLHCIFKSVKVKKQAPKIGCFGQ